jgi:hypothetical protein
VGYSNWITLKDNGLGGFLIHHGLVHNSKASLQNIGKLTRFLRKKSARREGGANAGIVTPDMAAAPPPEELL